jgi:S-formylglutathione hydrolase
LTCTDENFITKAGAQRAAAAHGVALVCPDTSPRGAGIPGESDAWDFGVGTPSPALLKLFVNGSRKLWGCGRPGAGFYVNATQEPWSKNYRMYEYVTEVWSCAVGAVYHILLND